MFIHIDCNAFFASCEVATDPSLVGRPVVVANDNDLGGGVILALTAEAKNLGLRRGVPLFKVRRLLEEKQVAICHADHKKYHRISNQIMEAVQRQGIVLDFVQYSVDEFFGTIPVDEPAQVEYYTRKVKEHITDTTGIPVGCGCSQTYTLAKTATYFAKHYKGYNGVCVLPWDKRDQALALIAIGDVWGIGRKHRAALLHAGVETAYDFVRMDETEVQRLLGTMGLHTYLELKGIASIDLRQHDLQKSIMQSHTFGKMMTDKETLVSEVVRFAERCCAKLREQQGLCSSVTLFLSTNRYRNDLSQYRDSESLRLPTPTADTSVVIKAVRQLLDGLYREGYQYKQMGVILGNIVPEAGGQLDLFTSSADERRRRLLKVTDSVNRKYGMGTVHFS